MENLKKIFIQNEYILSKENSKAVEFKKEEDIIYLLPTKDLCAVIHPKRVENSKALRNRSNGITHSTAFTLFPKKQHTGQQPIQYGYSFKFISEKELDAFLSSIDQL
jgi:hypothetical protein